MKGLNEYINESLINEGFKDFLKNIYDVVTGKKRAEEIKNELIELDTTINRATEDLYKITNTTPYQKTAEVIQRKEELRQELKELEV